jgi:hypothetical protein
MRKEVLDLSGNSHELAQENDPELEKFAELTDE